MNNQEIRDWEKRFDEEFPKEQKIELEKSRKKIVKAGAKLDSIGTWFPKRTKDVEYKNRGVEYTIFEVS